MTDNENKILSHLHFRYPDPDATNIEMTGYLKIEVSNFNSAINSLEKEEYIIET